MEALLESTYVYYCNEIYTVESINGEYFYISPIVNDGFSFSGERDRCVHFSELDGVASEEDVYYANPNMII